MGLCGDVNVHVRGYGGSYFSTVHVSDSGLCGLYIPNLWMPECGANTVQVNIVPGRVSTVKYFMPPWMYASGSITLG